MSTSQADPSDRSMPRATAARAKVFVLRIWPEPRSFEGMTPVWRGSVNDIDGGQTRYFDRMTGLARILRDAAGQEAFLEDPLADGGAAP